MARIDELRLMTRVARMYYEQDMRQSEIAEKLDLSQATVSRLVKRAHREKIVRITVSVPNGIHSELEDALNSRYDLRHAVVVDCVDPENEEEILNNLGAAAAHFLETTIEKNECIGISSWSATLLAMVNAMHQIPKAMSAQVVQILGGASESSAKTQAIYLASQLADLVRGEVTFLRAPVVVGSEEARDILLNDPYVAETVSLFDEITLALVGIGAIDPSPLLASSGNLYSAAELAVLREHGAVGDVLLHFFDRQGRPVNTHLDNRVIGMSLDQLKRVKRRVGIAGGRRKHEAIRGAVLGGQVNVLITDRFTAEELVRS
ncbi:MAG: sugar-binding transcriptional regulator [Anaerolineae bacterium]|nr:sugar-binding transcriptional regulator [Anaerolineae bacterium]